MRARQTDVENMSAVHPSEPGYRFLAGLTLLLCSSFTLAQSTFTHVHMRVPDPNEMRDRFVQVFGGDYVETRGRGRFHTILYDDLWVHISASPDGERGPSQGRAIDHLGFTVASLDEFRATLATVGIEPYLQRSNPPGSDLMFFVGIGGIHFEISERRRQ
jgi:catechol 2,3-dioxygenase-like lactoylglutathione lyase family enzyme